jgi:hypothetical protein
MYLYNVTVNIDDSAHAEWKNWMLETHIPEVLATGQFVDCRFTRVLVEEESGTTYSIQYRFEALEDFQLYQELYAPALRQQSDAKFGSQQVAFRTLLEIQHEFRAERLDE